MQYDNQIGCNKNIRGRSFPITGRNLYCSSEQVQQGVKSLLEPIKTHNPFREPMREHTFNDSLQDNVVFPKYSSRDASWDTPINPLRMENKVISKNKGHGVFNTFKEKVKSKVTKSFTINLHGKTKSISRLRDYVCSAENMVIESDCCLRKQMNVVIPEKRKQFVQSTLQKSRKLCLYCGKSGHLIADCYSRKNQMRMITLEKKEKTEQKLSNQVVQEVVNENKKHLVHDIKLKNCFEPHENSCYPTLVDESMASHEKEKTELVSNAASPVKETHLEPRSTVDCDQESYGVVPNSEIVPEWLGEGNQQIKPKRLCVFFPSQYPASIHNWPYWLASTKRRR